MGQATPVYHYLQISCTGEQGDWIGRVGGAGFEPGQASDEFAKIPSCTGEGPGPAVLLDYLNEEGEIQDTKEISFETASRLLGIPITDIYPTAKADAKKREGELQKFLAESRK